MSSKVLNKRHLLSTYGRKKKTSAAAAVLPQSHTICSYQHALMKPGVKARHDQALNQYREGVIRQQADALDHAARLHAARETSARLLRELHQHLRDCETTAEMNGRRDYASERMQCLIQGTHQRRTEIEEVLKLVPDKLIPGKGVSARERLRIKIDKGMSTRRREAIKNFERFIKVDPELVFHDRPAIEACLKIPLQSYVDRVVAHALPAADHWKYSIKKPVSASRRKPIKVILGQRAEAEVMTAVLTGKSTTNEAFNLLRSTKTQFKCDRMHEQFFQLSMIAAQSKRKMTQKWRLNPASRTTKARSTYGKYGRQSLPLDLVGSSMPVPAYCAPWHIFDVPSTPSTVPTTPSSLNDSIFSSSTSSGASTTPSTPASSGSPTPFSSLVDATLSPQIEYASPTEQDSNAASPPPVVDCTPSPESQQSAAPTMSSSATISNVPVSGSIGSPAVKFASDIDVIKQMLPYISGAGVLAIIRRVLKECEGADIPAQLPAYTQSIRPELEVYQNTTGEETEKEKSLRLRVRNILNTDRVKTKEIIVGLMMYKLNPIDLFTVEGEAEARKVLVKLGAQGKLRLNNFRVSDRIARGRLHMENIELTETFANDMSDDAADIVEDAAERFLLLTLQKEFTAYSKSLSPVDKREWIKDFQDALAEVGFVYDTSDHADVLQLISWINEICGDASIDARTASFVSSLRDVLDMRYLCAARFGAYRNLDEVYPARRYNYLHYLPKSDEEEEEEEAAPLLASIKVDFSVSS